MSRVGQESSAPSDENSVRSSRGSLSKDSSCPIHLSVNCSPWGHTSVGTSRLLCIASGQQLPVTNILYKKLLRNVHVCRYSKGYNQVPDTNK